MKKNYVKPQIIIESFSLSETIAAGCNFLVKNPTEGICGYLDERDPTGLAVFTADIAGCKRTEVDGAYNGICYHVPNDTNDLFNS